MSAEIARLKAEAEREPTVRRRLAYAIACAKSAEHDTEAMRIFTEFKFENVELSFEQAADVYFWVQVVKKRWHAVAQPRVLDGLVNVDALHRRYPRGMDTLSKRRLWDALHGVDGHGEWPDPEERR